MIMLRSMLIFRGVPGFYTSQVVGNGMSAINSSPKKIDGWKSDSFPFGMGARNI